MISHRGRRPGERGAFATMVFLVLASAASAIAHPIHTSIAEADYNRSTRKLEVAVRVFADDFEVVLSARAKKKISFEQTPAAELDALTRAYLAERFVVQLADKTPAPHEWIGRELKEASNELWLFFQLPLPAGIEGRSLHHALLAEQFPSQINSVHIRDGDRKTTLVFLARHTAKIVRFRP